MGSWLPLFALAITLSGAIVANGPAPPETTPPATLPTPPGALGPFARRPDLTCSIEVRSVATNQEVLTGHNAPHGDYRVTVRVTQKGAPASHKIALTYNWGTTTGTVWDWHWVQPRRAEILSVGSGETVTAAVFDLNTECARICSVRIEAGTDADREIAESDEKNNKCAFQFLGLVFD